MLSKIQKNIDSMELISNQAEEIKTFLNIQVSKIFNSKHTGEEVLEELFGENHVADQFDIYADDLEIIMSGVHNLVCKNYTVEKNYTWYMQDGSAMLNVTGSPMWKGHTVEEIEEILLAQREIYKINPSKLNEAFVIRYEDGLKLFEREKK